ncbi:MAG: family 78 glycoside hydrolase catalytic domain [Hyphomicrobiales bacterium]
MNEVKSAKLFITADSRYRLSINGAEIAFGPARSWPHAQGVDEIDVTPHLHAGENTITVTVYAPGYSHFAYVHRGAHGLLCWLMDGKTCLLTSDQTWQVQRDNSWDEQVPRVSIYGAGVERRDLRKELSAAWQTPRIVQPAEGPIWSGLTPRDVPLLQTVLQRPPVWKMVKSRHPREGGDPASFSGEAQTPHDKLRQAFTPRSPFTVAIFDLGLSLTGRAVVTVTDATGGETLLVSYAEKLRDGEVLLSDPATYCRMQVTDEYTLRSGNNIAAPFSQRGARYVIVALAQERPETTFTFHFEETRYPLEATRDLPGADDGLKAISALCHRTLTSTLQDGFVDSVWRESSQWLGDAVAQDFALAAISKDLRPLARVITMAAQGAYGDGLLPSVLPGEVHAYAVVDYNFSWIELLQAYVTCAPKRAADMMLTAQLPVLEKMLGHFATQVASDGLLRADPGRRLFLDWSAVPRAEPSLTYNARYLHALQVAQALARSARARKLSATLAAREKSLARAITKAFHHTGAWQETTEGAPASQLALALLLLTRTISGETVQAIADAIIARSLDLDDTAPPGKLILASPFMHHYVFQGLEAAGRSADIIPIIRARWGRWADAGEATCWENWNVDFPDGSKCHGFSAHPLGWLARLAS